MMQAPTSLKSIFLPRIKADDADKAEQWQKAIDAHPSCFIRVHQI
jgi:hypothetical protein